MKTRFEPFIGRNNGVAAQGVRQLLFRIGTEEKHWPAAEVGSLLTWPEATFVAAPNSNGVVGE